MKRKWLFLLLFFPMALFGDTLFIEKSLAEREANLSLTWNSPLSFEHEINENELILRFNQKIDEEKIAELQKELAPFVSSIETGYNSLVFVGKKGVSYKLNREKDTLLIALTLEEQQEESFAIKLAIARLAVEGKAYAKASPLLYALSQEYPEEADVYSLWAAMEEGALRWQWAIYQLEKALSLRPRDDSLKEAKALLFFPHTSYVRFIRELQRTLTSSAEQYYRLHGEVLLGTFPPAIYLGGKLELNRAHIREVLTPQLIPEGFLGNRYRAVLYFKHEALSGATFKGSLYFSTKTVGFGVKATSPYALGEMGVKFDFKRPYWDILETLRNFGTVDQLEVFISAIFSRYFQMKVDTGVHRYGTAYAPNTTKTIILGSEARFDLHSFDPIVSLNYELDAEYVKKERTKRNPLGTVVEIIPLDSRENHTVTISLTKTWHVNTEFFAFFGKTFNRIGLNDYTYGLAVRYFNLHGFEAAASAETFPSTTQTGLKEDVIKGSLTLRF